MLCSWNDLRKELLTTMAIPSSKYAEDENARQTLANGTVLKWTKTNSELYAVPNVATDRSICYCNWAGELDYANRGFHQWQGGCVTGDDLGHNGNEGSGFANLHANSLKQIEFGQPRMEGLYTGVVLTDSDGDGTYVWGYNPEAAACLNSGNGGSRRYLLDMDINKMIFNITVNVYDQADFDAIDYLNSNNPESNQLPSTHNITLKQLYENPDDYYVDSFNWGTTYVYGENTNDHWRGTTIRPAHIINSENVGQFKGTRNLGIFGMHYASGNFSYDNSNPMNPNAHPTFGGGGSTPVIYNNMNNGYFMGCGKEINLNPVYSYSAVGTSAESIAQYKWGTASSWNRNAYVNQEFFDYGGSVIWCAYGAHAYYNHNTSESKYKEYFFFTRKMLKGQYALDYIASFGLYFAGENFDPDSVNLTPETLGDDNRIMLGEMSADGTTTGRWITDIDSYHGPNKDGKTSNPTYDPSGGGGGADNPWDVDPETYGWGGGEVSGMVKYYLLTAGEMDSLQTAIASNNNWTIDFLNCVVSCFVVPNNGLFFDAPIPTTVKFVLDNATKWDTGVSCKRIQGTINKSGGTIEIPRLTNTFYDFEPYSDYSVYIPFCGRVPIKGNVCLGREIKVTYYPDVPTCSLTAVISCGGATIAIAKGSFGTMTPITSNGSDRKTAAVIGDVAPIITGIGTGIVGVALGNPLIVGAGAAQALGGIMGGVKETVQSYAYSVGSTGDSSFFGAGNRCFYYANYPIIDDVVNDSMFGHSVGYLCNTVGKLSGFTGFTMCANPHVTFSASAEEREEIERLLSMGVIL